MDLEQPAKNADTSEIIPIEVVLDEMAPVDRCISGQNEFSLFSCPCAFGLRYSIAQTYLLVLSDGGHLSYQAMFFRFSSSYGARIG